MYTIFLRKQVKKFLASHDMIARIFYQKLKKIQQGKFDEIDTKKLVGQQNKYRLRIGRYRFLYELHQKEVRVYFYEAGKRGDIYK